MSPIFAAIDVETTGLDPDRDAIIEVAVILFRDADILEEFSSLVNPGRDLPPEITRLTGITQAMVDGAPTMYELRGRLRALLANHVLVGHNVTFDLNFLTAERLAIGNPHLDTMTLASILVPEAGRFGLDVLARHLQLPDADSGQDHRALADAEQTVELFLALKERALALELDQLEEIVLNGRRIDWPETRFFEEALAAKTRHAFSGSSPRRARGAALFNPPKPDGRPLVPNEKIKKLDTAVLVNMLQPGGNFSRVFDGFEHRPQQVQMLQAVSQAFNQGQHLLVEAGTGTGKSVAYLLPAAFWAQENGRRVVISTNTINLQDQLINKDIPDLQKALPFTLRAAVRKGRSNYVCTRLFQQLRHNGPRDADEMVLFARILLWLPRTQTGDMAELVIRTPGERLAWQRLNGDNAVCTMDHCANANCPLHLARRRAELAHIVIVNHALLLSDVAGGGHILPEFKDLIIDEGHHLEAAVTDGLSFRADKRSLEAILDEVTRPRSGLLYDAQTAVANSTPPVISAQFNALADTIRQNGQLAAIRLEEFFETLAFFFANRINKRAQFPEQIRLLPALRTQPDYAEVESSWDNLNKQLKTISKGVAQLAEMLSELSTQYDLSEGEDTRLMLQNHALNLEEIRLNLHAIIAAPAEEMIYWVEAFKDQLSLHAAPLHVGPLVEKHIFDEKETVIITSATMRTAAPDSGDEPGFAYLKSRLHATHASEMAVGSPFDYKNRTLLFLASDMPEPNQPGYQQYVERAIVDVARALGGRTMALFTAYGQLQQTARAIEGPLSQAGIMLLAQSSNTSRQQMLEQFKRPDARAVLLGTRSFWEGVDVPGAALQAVVIVKLPFDVPSDPIFAARSETFENSFFEYAIPEAVLRFRQGFGRLIRRQDDEGVVVILDKRVLTKRYGRLFLEALPECMVLRQRTDRLGELTLRWLNRDKTQRY